MLQRRQGSQPRFAPLHHRAHHHRNTSPTLVMARHKVRFHKSTIKYQHDAPSLLSSGSVANSLNVVPGRVQHKRSIVRRPEMRPHARLAVALAARSNSRLVERLDSSPICTTPAHISIQSCHHNTTEKKIKEKTHPSPQKRYASAGCSRYPRAQARGRPGARPRPR